MAEKEDKSQQAEHNDVRSAVEKPATPTMLFARPEFL